LTTTRIRYGPASAELSGSHAGTAAVIAAFAGGLTFVIRLALHGRSFDLFGDEVIYTDIGRSVISGGFPRFGREPFFLHGPGFFYLEAGWARIVGNPPGLMAWIYEMRALNALFAGATAVALVLLATRVSSLKAGAAVGFLFALDPFCIRQNDRVLLETAMMFWVILGCLVFISLIGRPPSRRGWPNAVGAGLLFGCAVLTKDEGALLTVLPLLAAAVLGWGPRRGLTLLTVGTTVAVYSVYVAVVAANGQFPGLWEAKTSGIQRMLGFTQITGFHSSKGGNLSSRLIAEVIFFGTTYVALALAVPALLVVLRRGRQLPRMLGLLYCAAGVTLGYALVLGTLEEQELYLLVVPSLLTIPVAVTLLHKERQGNRSVPQSRPGVLATVAIITGLTLALGLDAATCVQWLRQRDDTVTRLLQYISAHVPASTAITDPTATLNVPSDVIQYALDNRYSVGPWLTPSAQSREHVGYILVQWGLISKGYSSIPTSELRHLVARDRLIFSASGRSYGQVALYKIPSRPPRARQ